MPAYQNNRPSENASENFVKAVYNLIQKTGESRVSTNALADVLQIKAPSVTDMAQRLEELGLVDYIKYRGVALTVKGHRLALQILRRHRLIELYLVNELGYQLHEVHAEAEVLEHHVSDRFIEALAYKLGDPDLDPHGDPIPNRDGMMIERNLQPLSQLAFNRVATVARIGIEQDELLKLILQKGLCLGAQVTSLHYAHDDETFTISVLGVETVISQQIAMYVMVEQ
ncbi:MAG: metal-dependent transcriptional regulator [Phototrophicaceae bacterium]